MRMGMALAGGSHTPDRALLFGCTDVNNITSDANSRERSVAKAGPICG